MMFLIVGLGNPGAEYAKTRHNAGFLFLDDLAQDMGPTAFFQDKFQAQVMKTSWKGYALVLAKPQTFMNLSGKSVVQLLNFYKIPVEQMVVLFDDLDLPCGAIKSRIGGGAGGHNGVSSILSLVSGDKFHRIKIGIGRPEFKGQTTNWVLGSFTGDETTLLEKETFPAAKKRLEETLRQIAKKR